MSQKKASEFFRGADRLNCAQAVLKFFEDHPEVTSEKIAELKTFGNGRAPEGECGALHAACKVLQPEKIKDLQSAFIKEAGSTKCREIRKINKLPCRGCVDLAADFAKDKTR